MVISPAETAFFIDVKGLHSRNHWVVKPKPKKYGLFYVLALVPAHGANSFFVLRQDEADVEIAECEAAIQRRAKARGKPAAPGFDGIPAAAAEKYRDAWTKLPDWPVEPG
jgi:hypothetical protein